MKARKEGKQTEKQTERQTDKKGEKKQIVSWAFYILFHNLVPHLNKLSEEHFSGRHEMKMLLVTDQQHKPGKSY